MYTPKQLGIKLNFNKCKGLSRQAKRVLGVLHNSVYGICILTAIERYGEAVNELIERGAAAKIDSPFGGYSLELDYDFWKD